MKIMEPAVCAHHHGGQSINKNERWGISEKLYLPQYWKLKVSLKAFEG